MTDPELQSKKPPRKPSASAPKHRAEIKIWITQPKLDLLESAIGQLCEREPKWRQTAEALAKEARLPRLLKVLESFKRTDVARQQEIFAPACSFCFHSLHENQHGLDQNDIHMEGDSVVHSTRCTYCKECNPRLKELLK